MESFGEPLSGNREKFRETSPLESSFDGKCPISARLQDSQRTKPKMKQGLTGKTVKSMEIDVRPSFDFTHSKAKIRGVKRCWGTDIPNGAR